ncbi:CLUMA_CG021114, isoform A [Clunio marinus]|uniref:CLUMA_CG021114, isoform A n=1 Tax=Clunio marinus TaxID=568069 RepID=A0A1J1JA55_9DIPT|nr:CLUMA_CG021114, isoform A [Clunio marinus]
MKLAKKKERYHDCAIILVDELVRDQEKSQPELHHKYSWKSLTTIHLTYQTQNIKLNAIVQFHN